MSDGIAMVTSLNDTTGFGAALGPDRSDHPRRIGAYTILGGLGGSAGALLARRDGDGELAVLRMPLDPGEADAFRTRARALAAVRHPALVPILGVGEDRRADGTSVPFLAEEHRAGGSLRELLRELSGMDLENARACGRDRLPGSGSFEARAASVGARIADALDALHAAGVAHGAVRPAAILFRVLPNGDVDVALGGYRLDEAARWSDGLGYAAPECVRDHGPATLAADLIGLAATLYELLALHPAFDEGDPGGLVRAVREHEPARPTSLQPFLRPETDAVLLQALEKLPGRRPQSVAALAEDLRALAAGRPVTARAPAWWRRAWGRLREHRRELLVLIAFGTAVGLAAARMR